MSSKKLTHQDLLPIFLAKSFKKDDVKKVKSLLTAGECEYDLTVRLQGVVKIGDAYEQLIATKVPWAMLAAVALSKCNDVTLDAVLVEVFDLMDTDEGAQLEDQIKDRARAAVDVLKTKTLTVCQGKLTARNTTAEVVAGAVTSSSLERKDVA